MIWRRTFLRHLESAIATELQGRPLVPAPDLRDANLGKYFTNRT